MERRGYQTDTITLSDEPLVDLLAEATEIAKSAATRGWSVASVSGAKFTIPSPRTELALILERKN